MFVVIMLNKSFDNPHQKHPFHSQILSGLFDESSRWLVGGFSFETKLFKGGGGGGGVLPHRRRWRKHNGQTN